MKRRAVFLSCSPSGYLFTCIERLVKEYELEALVVHYPLDKNAPFKFSIDTTSVSLADKSAFEDSALTEKVKSFAPDVIFCSGWADALYRHICKSMKGKTRCVVKFDNPWLNTLKQNLMRVIGPLYLRQFFDACWVSGKPQREYALRCGFSDDEISEGGYSGHYEYFHQAYLNNKEQKRKKFPHRFIYVGRYIPVKGVDLMWKAFEEFQKETPNDWELWCLGKGELKPLMPDHPSIKDFGFVQPAEMEKFVAETGVFIMSSIKDHWGVAVHEYAAAGFPLVCSSGVYAHTGFLQHGINGFLHKPGSKQSLKEALRKIISLSDEQLFEMGNRSAEIAAVMTPSVWASIAWQFASSNQWPQFRFPEINPVLNKST
jgi:glycosyltransferase involved in cell wall biosynthesis